MSLLLRESPQSLKKYTENTSWKSQQQRHRMGGTSHQRPIRQNAELDALASGNCRTGYEMPSIVPAQTSISIPAETDTSTANADSAATDSAKMAATKIDSSLFCNANSVVFKNGESDKECRQTQNFPDRRNGGYPRIVDCRDVLNPSEWTDVASGWPCYNRPLKT